jgi:hypothetical protein
MRLVARERDDDRAHAGNVEAKVGDHGGILAEVEPAARAFRGYKAEALW